MDKVVSMFKWMMEHWKPACALIYTVICVFDFVVFPCWVGWHRMPVADFLEVSKGLDVTMKNSLYEYLYRQYIPYTLSNGGLFHLSFGAILTGAVFGSKPTIIADRRKIEDAETAEKKS